MAKVKDVGPLVLSLFSGLALGQSTPQPFYPTCWMWSYPVFQSGDRFCSEFDRNKYFIPIIRVRVNDTLGPSDAANAAGGRIIALRALNYPGGSGCYSQPVLDPNARISLLLQDFGVPKAEDRKDTQDPSFYASSLFVEDDNVNVDIDNDPLTDNWPATDSSFGSRRAWRQPWMTQGIVHAGTWMNAFLNAYKNGPTGQLPNSEIARFHFDFETAITDSGNANFPFLLYAMTQDATHGNRWSNTAVPGFGTLTMQNLWDQAQTRWTDGGPSGNELWDQFATAQGGLGAAFGSYPLPLDRTRAFYDVQRATGSHTIHNRDLFLWYESIASRARDGAMNQAAYLPIKNYYTNCKTSNYGDTVLNVVDPTTGLVRNDDFGWHEFPGHSEPPTVTRSSPRGFMDRTQHGHHPCILDDEYASSSAYGYFAMTQDHTTSADFSAPFMYLTGNNTPKSADDTNPDDGISAGAQCAAGENKSDFYGRYRQVNPYLKNWPIEALGGTAGQRDYWTVALRSNRRWLENVINSYGEAGNWGTNEDDAPWSKVCPWVVIPGSPATPSPSTNGSDGSSGLLPPETQDDDANRLLGLLKSKRIREMIPWNSDPGGQTYTTPYYSRFDRVYRQVYDPTLVAYSNSIQTRP